MTLHLDRLNANVGYINPQGRPTSQLMIFWQKVMKAIEDQFTTLTQAVTDIATAQSDISDLATDAAALAAEVVTTKGKGEKVDILTSYVDDTGAITAADVGADATITIAAHNRRYATSTVAVNSGTVTGQTFSTLLHIYYDDPTAAGGAVTYHAVSTAVGAAHSAANAGRHYVGSITTPANGAGPTTGTAALPPGAIVG